MSYEIGMDPDRRDEPPVLVFYQDPLGDGGQQAKHLRVFPANQGNQQNRLDADCGNQGAFFSRTLRKEGAFDPKFEIISHGRLQNHILTDVLKVLAFRSEKH